MTYKFRSALVIGAGAFGTSIATVVAQNFKNVILKVRSEDTYENIQSKKNDIYLPGHTLSDNINGAMSWEEVESKISLTDIDLIISGLPAAALVNYFHKNKDKISSILDRDVPLVSLSKGIDPVTLDLPDDIFYDLFPGHKDSFYFLSGPSFAKEIMQEQITLVSLAGRSTKDLKRISEMLGTPFFKVFPTYDVKGVLLGGALKNVLAIAGGAIEGLGYTHNTRAAMITRGIAEMLRFGKVFNARPETFYGLSGMGDLILTTTGGLSRNKQFGMEIAKGRKAKEIINSSRSVVEGYKTTKAVHFLCEKYEIRASIFEAVYSVLYEDKDPNQVIQKLMKVPARFED